MWPAPAAGLLSCVQAASRNSFFSSRKAVKAWYVGGYNLSPVVPPSSSRPAQVGPSIRERNLSAWHSGMISVVVFAGSVDGRCWGKGLGACCSKPSSLNPRLSTGLGVIHRHQPVKELVKDSVKQLEPRIGPRFQALGPIRRSRFPVLGRSRSPE